MLTLSQRRGLMVKKEMTKKELEKKNEELMKDLQRLQAEFDNYRKREENNKKQFLQNANKNLIEKMIPILDNFELAIKSSPDGATKQGMEMIYSQILTILQDEGLKKIDPLNEEFNPEFHEAIMVEKGNDDKITEVLQPGYALNETIIRHAKVKIRRKEK